MLNLKSCFVFVCCLFCTNLHANTELEIRNYITQHFPTLQITKAQSTQLVWANAHVLATPDLHGQGNTQTNFVEIGRALTRLYCAQLLRAGTRAAYNDLVAAQLQANNPDVLSFASFTKLSQHIQNIEVHDYQLLETAAILSAVSLSKPAAELANHAMLGLQTNDRLEFLATTLRTKSNIYPLLEEVLEDNDAAQKLLYVLFPPQTNFRHMLYTESGIGMFKYLRAMIRHGFLDQRNLDLWFAHWIIDIAGFRGHVAQNGALYLNEATAQAMFKLQDLVYRMLDAPNFDPLVPYLEYRAQLLGLQHLPTSDRLFMTHLGCMLRLYNIEQGRILYKTVSNMRIQDLNMIREHFAIGLESPQQTAHLHLPAWFGNTMQFYDQDLTKTLTLILPAYNTILKQAKHTKSLNLSFAQLAIKQNVARLRQNKNVTFTIMPDGMIVMH